ncbi:uncharacterized protein [Musca autumnalis]|uniref:uncharacterized protein n=1 Tax=Musca autumnalis TaxID=221902 RepID=UPI003CECDF21
MEKLVLTLAFLVLLSITQGWAGPVEAEKSTSSSADSDDDMKTSETFGYGYYHHQPALYTAPQALYTAAPPHSPPLATVASYHPTQYSTVTTYPVAPALATTSTLLSSSSVGGARSASGYGYGSGYKYGHGYGFGNRYGYGNSRTATTNEYYRRQPVYVAWG